MNADDTTIASTRMDEEGNFIQPLIPFGKATASYLDTLNTQRYATDPVSGNSYSAGANGPLWVNGHRRDGTPLWEGPREAFDYWEDVTQISLGADPEGPG